MSAHNNKKKQRLAKLLLILMGLFFGCIVAEVALRIIGYSNPIFFESDADRGQALLPGAEGWFWTERKNLVRINSDGFRDREHTLEKPADTVRIAVLGDSFAEARNVSPEAAFWAVAEHKLEDCGAFAGRRVEVMNFGVSGYSTAQELLTLRQRVWKYSPDVVLLAFTTYNDVMDNYRPFKNADEIPYFVFTDGQLTYDSSFRGSKKFLWFDSTAFKTWVAFHNGSRLIQVLHHAQFAIKTRISAWNEERRVAEAQKALDSSQQSPATVTAASLSDAIGLQNMVYREPDDRYWTEAWQITEAIINQMHDEVQEHGARFMLVTITADIQVYPDPAVRETMMKRIGVTDLFYPDRRLAAFADREKMDFVTLAPAMQSYADSNRIFLHGFDKELGNGHWNESGHNLAGLLIAEKMCHSLPPGQ